MADSTPHGGWYSQDDVREIVRYASDRFITVVPEIEMPGHALAALAAYPELSCTGGPFNVGTEWGVFDDVFCAGNEKTFDFLFGVLDEVAALFPGTMVHIGGDECPKSRWHACPLCHKRITTEGLKNEDELQSYFIGRIGRYLSGKGKRLLGWDEILEGGLAPDATVMSWRGMKGGIAAAQAGHDVVMTPTSHCYFDYSPGKFGEPPNIGGFLPLDTVYAFEPVPPELTPAEAAHVLGGQGNVWTEWMPDSRRVEYMVLPRMPAISEVLWTSRERRSFSDFLTRLEPHYGMLAARGYEFRVPPPGGMGGTVVIFADTSLVFTPPVRGASVMVQIDEGAGFGETLAAHEPKLIRGDVALKTWTAMRAGQASVPVTTWFQRVDRNRNGVTARVYEGKWDKLPDFSALVPLSETRVYAIDLASIFLPREYYGVVMDGFIDIEHPDTCTFSLTSDDGSRLLIDGTVVVDNDGLHGMRERKGTVVLAGGNHRIRVEYFQGGGGAGLDVQIGTPFAQRRPIPARLLSLSPASAHSPQNENE